MTITFSDLYGSKEEWIIQNSRSMMADVSTSRRMPGHIREFNRLEPHSSHDLVFKIWRNNKTEATFGVFCL